MNAQQTKLYKQTFKRHCELGETEQSYYKEGSLFTVKEGMEESLKENKREQLILSEMLDDISHNRDSLEPTE